MQRYIINIKLPNLNLFFKLISIKKPVVIRLKISIFAVTQTTRIARTNTTTSCELLQKVYLCSNTNNAVTSIILLTSVVNCFKKCIFAVTQTTPLKLSAVDKRCELLQKVYLCSNTNNLYLYLLFVGRVVNCFKTCIFAVTQPTYQQQQTPRVSCELLQKVYLCSNTNNISATPLLS